MFTGGNPSTSERTAPADRTARSVKASRPDNTSKSQNTEPERQQSHPIAKDLYTTIIRHNQPGDAQYLMQDVIRSLSVNKAIVNRFISTRNNQERAQLFQEYLSDQIVCGRESDVQAVYSQLKALQKKRLELSTQINATPQPEIVKSLAN